MGWKPLVLLYLKGCGFSSRPLVFKYLVKLLAVKAENICKRRKGINSIFWYIDTDFFIEV